MDPKAKGADGWLEAYELVTSLDEATALLAEPGWAILGGGSRLVAHKPPDQSKLIDLLPLGLDAIERGDGVLRLGARARLAEIEALDDLDALLRAAALSLAHSPRLRQQMTLAGETAWPEGTNELQAALIALDATIVRHDLPPTPAAAYLAGREREGIVTAVEIPLPDPAAGWRHGLVALRPDPDTRPWLVLAAALRAEGGRVAAARLGRAGLGVLPRRLEDLEARLTGVAVAELPALLADAAAALAAGGSYPDAAAATAAPARAAELLAGLALPA